MEKVSAQRLLNKYGERLILDASGAIFWKRHRWLIISDLHLGKSMHFRKQGIAMPVHVEEENLRKIERVIEVYKPRKVILLGDLFHSVYNAQWERITGLTSRFRPGYFVLIKGNHDILPDWHYYRTSMKICDKELIKEPFLFTHEPTKTEGSQINVAGHIHPAVRMHGKGKQSLRFPCFLLADKLILMPAFGEFTGSARIPVPKDSEMYAIVEDLIIKVK
jgi:DNA ligase-associated metallophosphoesterase